MGRGKRQGKGATQSIAIHPALDTSPEEECWWSLPDTPGIQVSVETAPKYLEIAEPFLSWARIATSTYVYGPAQANSPNEAVEAALELVHADKAVDFSSLPPMRAPCDPDPDCVGRKRHKYVPRPEAKGELSIHTEDDPNYDDSDDERVDHSICILGYSPDGEGFDVDRVPKFFDGGAEEVYLVTHVYDSGSTFSYESGLHEYMGVFDRADYAKEYARLLAAWEQPDFFGGRGLFEVSELSPLEAKRPLYL